jgi:hypothetical protein
MSSASKILAITLLAGALACAAEQACAEELWDPHLRGVDEGMAAGALPPPGVYGVLNNYWAGYDQFDNHGNKTGVKLDALVEVPIVLWSTGIKILGADYAVAIAQPFDYTNIRLPNTAALSDNAHWGTFNTIFVPGQLSWTLPNNFYVKAGLTIYVDDASSSPARPPSGGGVGAGNGYWTLQPDLGVSWLSDGWDVSIGMSYAYNFEDSKIHRTSGQEIAVDYTVTKTIGKWTFGLGAHQENQLNADSGSGAVSAGCPASGGCMAENYGIGPLIGYQFEGINVLAEYNQNLHTRNDVAGTIFNIRLVMPFQ